MPIAVDPDQSVPFSLKCDRDKPQATRPAFLCRALSRREARKVADMLKQAYDEKDDAKSYEMLNEVFKACIVGWQNITNRQHEPLPFDLNEIDAVLTETEMWELAWSCPRAGELAVEEVPLSAGQSDASGATPAVDAPQNDASPVTA